MSDEGRKRKAAKRGSSDVADSFVCEASGGGLNAVPTRSPPRSPRPAKGDRSSWLDDATRLDDRTALTKRTNRVPTDRGPRCAGRRAPAAFSQGSRPEAAAARTRASTRSPPKPFTTLSPTERSWACRTFSSRSARCSSPRSCAGARAMRSQRRGPRSGETDGTRGHRPSRRAPAGSGRQGECTAEDRSGSRRSPRRFSAPIGSIDLARWRRTALREPSHRGRTSR